MDMLFTYMDLIAPTFLSVLSVALFRKRTRWLCYVTVALAITAELISLSTNVIGLTACIACLVALLVGDFIRTHQNLLHLRTPTARSLLIKHH